MRKVFFLIFCICLTADCMGDLSADFNRDGLVDFKDFSIFAKDWLCSGSPVFNEITFLDLPHMPKANYIGESIFFDAMDDYSSFVSCNATLSYDTDNYKCSSSGRSIKLTADGTGTVPLFLWTVPSMDLTNAHCMMRIFIPEGSGSSSWDKITHVQVHIYDSSNNRRRYQIWSSENDAGVRGWTELNWLEGEYYDQHVGFDIADITKIVILFVTRVSTDIPSIVFDQLEFYSPKNTKGFVMVRFDAQYELQKEALAYMLSKQITGSSRRLRGNVCIAPDYVGVPGRLSLDELKEIRDAGHFVMLYTNMWNTTPQSEKAAKLEAWQQWMIDNGFSEGAKFAAHSTSYHWTYEDRNVIKPTHLDGVLGGVENGKREEVRPLWDVSFIPWTDFGTITPETIAKAVSHKGCLTLGAHIVDYDELSNFKAAIDLIVTEINNGTLIPVTYDELYSGVGLF